MFLSNLLSIFDGDVVYLDFDLEFDKVLVSDLERSVRTQIFDKVVFRTSCDPGSAASPSLLRRRRLFCILLDSLFKIVEERRDGGWVVGCGDEGAWIVW